MKAVSRARGNNRRSACSGFTLIELMMVALLLALFFAIAIPRLWPAIAFGEHEGAARRIANYGRAAIAECAMLQTRYTIKIDLDEQEYWTMRWPGFSTELAEVQGDMREAARGAMEDEPMAQGRDLQSLAGGGGMGQA
ncbi:MAG: prepilin-type N-terminal cleavage/methylation domain-containing protein, partial [Candidatus Hydrogenedentota bacterium]